MYKVIDAHVHIYPEAIADKACDALGKFYDFSIQGGGTYSDLERQSRRFRIGEPGFEGEMRGFMLLGVATTPHQVTKVNDSLAASVKSAREQGFECWGFAGMHQDYPDFAAEVERAESIGLTGVKIHPDIQGVDIDDDRLLRLYEIIEGRMPLFLHMGDWRPQYRFSEPKKLARVLRLFPRLKVVAAHYGGYQAWDEAGGYLWGNPNVWYDCSSSLWAMSPERARELTLGCGEDRVMYGTDYPVYSLIPYYQLFERISLTDEQRRKILYDNAKGFIEAAEKDAEEYKKSHM